MVTLELPWPPSVNSYWRNNRGRTHISGDGRKFRRLVELRCMGLGAFDKSTRLDVEILAHPPDLRRRDLDNILKATLDAIEHGGVYADDSQIDRLTIARHAVTSPGRLIVRIAPLTPALHCNREG